MKKTTIYAILISLAVIVFANSPFLYFSLMPKGGEQFLGRNYINSEDTYTYVSFIEQARQGRIFFENQYTSEAQRASLFRPSYLTIGLLAKFTGISSILAFHLSRVILSLILCFVLYKFLFLFFENEEKHLTAFTITLTSSGLGFLLAHYFPSSTDLWIPESLTFLSLEQAPHFILSLTLLLTGYGFFVKYLKDKNLNLLLLMFFAFFALSFEHPFDLVVAIPILFLTAVWNKISFGKSLGIAAFSGIGLIYQLFETYTNPVLKAWSSQNLLLSPSPTDYLIGFGLLTVFAVVGIELFLGELKQEQKFTIIWIIVTAFALYLPFNFQRRFVEGIQIPIAIFATLGVHHLIGLKKWFLTRVHFVVAIIIFTLSLGSIFTIYQDFRAYSSDSSDNPYYFIKSQDLLAIQWLGSKTNFNDVILSNRYFGNLIPGVIGRKVFLGHQIQTIDFTGKIEKTSSFLLEKDDKKALTFLKDNHITYIFLGIYDNMIQYGFKPDSKKYLTKVHENSGVSIYKVKY